MAKRVVFLHIRKTAGTSFRASLEKNFDVEARCPIRSQVELNAKFAPNLRRAELIKYDFIAGHFNNLNAFLSDEECTTFMFFRNPLERVISAYNHMKNDARDPLHKFVSPISLSEALDVEKIASEMRNSQFKYLYGNFESNFKYQDFTDRTNLKELEEDIWKKLRKIDHIGLTDFYKSSLKLFAKTCDEDFSFGKPEHRNKNITANGIKLEDLNENELSKIIKFNQLDTLVYRQACNYLTKGLQNIYNT